MGGEQDDVARDRGGVAVLLVGGRIARQRTTDAATSVGARSSLTAASGPAAALSRSSASGPSTRKRHGFVRLWLGAQRASSNSASSVARSTGSGRVGLVRAAGADQVGEVHGAARLDDRPILP